MSVEQQQRLWGGETAKAVENFPISGEGIPVTVVRWLGRIKAAAARVNAELGKLDPEMAERKMREIADELRVKWGVTGVAILHRTGVLAIGEASVGIAVSRGGGADYIRPMSKVAGQMKLELAQFRELAAFTGIASDLDPATRRQLDRGQRLTEMLKQPQYEPVPVGLQVAVIFAGTRGFLDKVPINKIGEWEQQFSRFVRAEHGGYLDTIEKEKKWDDSTIAQTEEIIKAFNRQFGVEGEDKKGEARTDEKPAEPKAEAKTEEKPAEPQAEAAGLERPRDARPGGRFLGDHHRAGAKSVHGFLPTGTGGSNLQRAIGLKAPLPRALGERAYR